jgi:SAM-dependent methyltransferase
MSVVAVDEVFSHALRGEPCFLTGVGPLPVRLPVEDWTRIADAEDQALCALCVGPTLDIGCGPGRLTAELAARGHVVLGIDVVHEAVRQTLQRGGAAIQRDVFGPVPGEGRWRTVLLADGNVGIGGDPVALLRRARRLLAPGGQVVVEIAGPDVASRRVTAQLQCACADSDPFAWSVVGHDTVAEVARHAGLVPAAPVAVGRRWAVVLREPLR